MESRWWEVYTRYQEGYTEEEGHAPDLNTVINRLCDQNALAPGGADLAHKVRLEANKALHEHPTAEKALEVFDAARLVILRMAMVKTRP